MTKILSYINGVLWGVPALALILTVGLYLSFRLGFAQLRLFPKAVKSFFEKLRPGKQQDNAVSPYRALCTALGATVGTGNLVGVAGAICLGGPGTVFWMWVCALLGMVTKYTEAILAVRFREKSRDGYVGGPMYVMLQGLGRNWKPMATCYCCFGCIAAYGVGNAAQINAVISGVNGVLIRFGGQEKQTGNFLMGIALAVLLGVLLFGGAQRIGRACETLVPFAAVGYMTMCAFALIANAPRIPAALEAIIRGAFDPRAVTGGMLGSSFLALRIGCSRGVFTNEAGMGTAAIAHGSAQVDHPAEQGMMGIMEVFLDTIVICTLTALVILTSGVAIPYGTDVGAELTTRAFVAVFGEGICVAIAAELTLFALATVLGWGLYGARCAEFLFGPRAWKVYAAGQVLTVLVASVAETAVIWQFSELVNGLMVIPNLITLALLAPEAARLTKDYRKSGDKKAGGGNYADFYQCKPL